MPKRTGTCGEGGAATADAKSRCPRAMHMRDDSCHAGVARATDHNQGIEGTYLPRAGQRGRAVSCEPAEPCACHSGTGESRMFYARRTLPNLTPCMHSPNLSSAGAVAEEAIRSQMNFCGVSMCWGSYPPWVLRSGTPPWSYPPKQKAIFSIANAVYWSQNRMDRVRNQI